MGGSRQGGLKAAATIKQRYGNDYYIVQGSKGGKASTGTTGFGSVKVGKDGLTGSQRASLASKKSWVDRNRRGE